MKKKYIIILSVFLGILILVALAMYSYYQWQVNTPLASSTETQTFTIEEGETPQSVGQRLEDGGFVRSALFFQTYLKLNPNLAQGIQAGEYEVSMGDSIEELTAMFQNGATLVRLTFIEGWRREQMAIYLVKNFGEAFAEEFLSISKNEEGYLFPDTYLVGTDVTPQGLVDLMKVTFSEKVGPEIEANLKEVGLTEKQLLIFASILEREIARPEDRKIVAGILLKRWRNGWLLGADATVQYAWASENCSSLSEDCNWWPHIITQQMLEIDSVHNTRKFLGLPPTSIANPGLNAIMSVLEAESSGYWYYLSDSEGNTHYAETIDGHNQNIARYL